MLHEITLFFMSMQHLMLIYEAAIKVHPLGGFLNNILKVKISSGMDKNKNDGYHCSNLVFFFSIMGQFPNLLPVRVWVCCLPHDKEKGCK